VGRSGAKNLQGSLLETLLKVTPGMPQPTGPWVGEAPSDKPLLPISELIPPAPGDNAFVHFTRGAVKIAEGMTSMKSLALIATLGAAGRMLALARTAYGRTAARLLDVGVDAYFATAAGKGLLESAPRLRKAYEERDYPTLFTELGQDAVQALFGTYFGVRGGKKGIQLGKAAKAPYDYVKTGRPGEEVVVPEPARLGPGTEGPAGGIPSQLGNPPGGRPGPPPNAPRLQPVTPTPEVSGAPMSGRQRAEIFARRNQIGLGEDAFAAAVKEVTGQESTQKLTGQQATEVLEALRKMQPATATPAATPQQIDRAAALLPGRKRINITAIEQELNVTRDEARGVFRGLLVKGSIDRTGRILEAEAPVGPGGQTRLPLIAGLPPQTQPTAQGAPPLAPGGLGEGLTPPGAPEAPPAPPAPSLHNRAVELASKFGKVTRTGLRIHLGIGPRQADALLTKMSQAGEINPLNGKWLRGTGILKPKQVPLQVSPMPERPPPTASREGPPVGRPPSTAIQSEGEFEAKPDDLPVERVGRTEEVSTPEGTKIQAQWRLVDLASDNLVTSHNYAGDENPDYPGNLQNRDRSRIASEAQIREIAADPDAKRLGRSYLLSEGAPLYVNLKDRRVVVSGNGRTEAVRLAYKQGTAEPYRAGLPDELRPVGIDPKSLEGIQEPMLARVAVGKVPLQKIARESNAPSVAERSPTELARADAPRLTGPLMDSFRPGDEGQIVTGENWPFIQTFFRELLSPAERGKYTLPDGGINQGGIARIRNAVFAKAYGKSSALENVSENPDDNVRNVTAAMLRAAPGFARLGEGIAAGQRHDLSIGPEISAAAGKLSFLRQQGTTIEDYLNHEELFAPELSPLARDLLRVLGIHARSATRLGEILNNYTAAVEALGSPLQGALIAGTIPTRAEVLAAAVGATETRTKAAADQRKAKKDVSKQAHENEAGGGERVGPFDLEPEGPGATPATPPPAEPAPETQGRVIPPVGPPATPTLPTALAAAKPRYSFGPKQFDLDFASDVDKAAYIAAQSKRSKADAQYVAFAAQHTGMTPGGVRMAGVRVRSAIKALARDAEPGMLRVPQVLDLKPAADPDAPQLEDAAGRARERLDDLFFDESGTFNASALRDAATVGAQKIASGFEKYSAWSKEMLRELGQGARRHLMRIWTAARNLLARYRSSRLGSERGSLSLFGEDAEAASRKEAKADAAKLEADRVTAEFKSPLNRNNLRKKLKPGEKPRQGDLFGGIPEEPPQGGLFGSQRGSISLRAKAPAIPDYRPRRKSTSLMGDVIDLMRPAGSVVERQGEAGKALKHFVDEAADAGDVEAGKRLERLQQSGVTKLNKPDRLKLVDVLRGVEPGTPELQQAAAQIHGLTDEIATKAETLGVEMLAGGRKVPFVRLANYFPQVMRSVEQLSSGEIRADVVQNLVHLDAKRDIASARTFLDDYLAWVETGGRRDSLIEHLIQSNQAKTKSEAIALLNRTRKNQPLRHGSLEFAREIDLPFWDPDPARVLPHWVAAVSQRLESIRVFGQKGAKGDLVQGLVEYIREAGGDVQFVEKAVDRMLGKINDLEKGRRVSAFVRTVQGFKLGLASIPNSTQGALNSLLYGDLRAVGAGFKGMLTKSGREFGMRSGAAIDTVLNEMTRDIGSDWHPLGVFLKATGFTGSERLNRIFAANAGASWAGRMARRLRINPHDSFARQALEELGVDPGTVKDGQLTGTQILRAAKKFSDITQFRARPQDLPFWASHPTGKIFFQFKSFVYGQARLVGRTTIEEARRGNYGRAARNFLILATVFPLAGEAIADLRSLLTGRERTAKGWKRYLEDIGQAGALGMLSDIFESAKYAGGLLKWIAGPTLSQIGEIGDAALRIPLAKDPWKAAGNFGKVLIKQVPLVGQLRQRIGQGAEAVGLPNLFPPAGKTSTKSPELRRLAAAEGE